MTEELKINPIHDIEHDIKDLALQFSLSSCHMAVMVVDPIKDLKPRNAQL